MPLLQLWDRTHHAENVKLVVLGQEVQEVVSALAIHNGFAPAELLADVEISAKKRLPCCILSKLPPNYSFIPDDSGYLVPKFRKVRSVVGHSFVSDGSSSYADPDFQPINSKAHHFATTSRGPASDRGSKKRKCAPLSLKEDPITGGSSVGKSQAVPFRLHRAAALAASLTPDEDAKCWGILHICGRKNCGVVAHYRPGSRHDNEEDEKYHRRARGCSRKRYPPLQ